MNTRLRVSAEPYRLPLRVPLVTGGRTYVERRGWWVRLDDAHGPGGMGEVAPLEAFGTESMASAQAELERLAVTGLRGPWPHDLKAVQHRLQLWQSTGEFRAVRAGLELALLDGLARRQGLSVSALFCREPLRQVPVQRLLGGQDPHVLAEQGALAIAQGFTTLKVKVGAGSVERDCQRIEALRERVGPSVRLRLDANGAWNLRSAREAMTGLRPFDIDLIEQPIPGADGYELGELRRLGIPIAVDEALGDLALAERVIGERRVDAVVLKPTLLGGLGVARRLAELARRHDVEVVVTSALERVVGLAGALHLAAAMGRADAPQGLATLDVFDPPDEGLEIVGGMVRVPTGPGLGVSVPRPRASRAKGRSSLIAVAAERWPKQLALRAGTRQWTYRELAAWVEQIAESLAALGLKPGDRLALWAPNDPHWVAIAHAAFRLGVVLVPLNTRLTHQELAWQCTRVGARWVLAGDGSPLPERLGETPVLAFSALPKAQGAAPEGADDPAAIQVLMFTSGTTGRPKAAMLTRANLLASARASNELLELCERDRWLLAMPLFHVGGLGILMRAALCGAGVVLHAGFEAEAVAGAIANEGITVISVVPTMLRRLLDHLPGGVFPASLRAMLVGGAPIPQEMVEFCPMALPTYGLTEAASHVTLCRPGTPWEASRGSGPAIPRTELRILDAAGRLQPDGTPGEIAVRGPQVFAGYWDDPAASAQALRDGWLMTGDEGVLDEQGHLHVLARRSDLIVSGGENLYPAEIEAALCRHPGILEAAVIPAADSTWGQVPLAIVVLSGHMPDLPELRAHLSASLASYKHPREFRVVAELPRLGSGKIDRHGLVRAFSPLA